MKTAKEMELKQKFSSLAKYCTTCYILDILYIFVLYIFVKYILRFWI